MWNIIVERLPDTLSIVCIVLAFVIPYSINKINQTLHKYGDPPWKQQGKQEEQRKQQN
ncbi:hypothetical protein [Aquibacillus sediminis]|uniref:hypothetical protein n=1 Tax=Aquibacillus sediminis TaxID=2574734 RepID=UPI0014872D4B|nr:hypothetical protein [Aquibacillus sediminis]